MKTITFIFPYKKVSGVPVLFARLANYISTNFDLLVQIVDYKGGVMDKLVHPQKNIKKIEFKDGHLTKPIENTTIIMQSVLPYSIRSEFNICRNTKVVFWNLFHYNLVCDFLPIRGLRKLHHRSLLLRKSNTGQIKITLTI